MTRLINKKDCTFEDHYIVKGDEIIPIELDVHDQLSMLEGMYQIALWLSKKPDYGAAPDVSDWRMESLIEEFHIGHIRKSLGSALSGGERRRAGDPCIPR